MKRSNRGFTLVDLVAVAAVICTFAAAGAPSLYRAKELSKRMVCSVNLRGIGAAAKLYSASNDGQWMIPGFRESLIDNGGIDYDPSVSSHSTPPQAGEVGYLRWTQSDAQSTDGAGGSSAVTVTRAYWMLVRSGDVTVQQFVCPSSFDDSVDGTENVALYYDFESYGKISYGYQVPFGPEETQPREGADPRRIHAADKGPFYFAAIISWETGPNGTLVTLNNSPHYWRSFNSWNHGGIRQGEGQNILFADGSVSFARIPAVGADGDNIYSVMRCDWDHLEGFNRIHGDNPHAAPFLNAYPGQGAFGSPKAFSATDTVVFP